MSEPITQESYYERTDVLSVSQVKSYMRCEDRAQAEYLGRYVRPQTEALTIGSYIDVMLTGTDAEVEEFRDAHPEMFSSRGPTKGQLKAAYQCANDMVARIRQDSDAGGLFMRFLEGDRQRIVTGEINGHAFKGKLDVLNLDRGFICDLKTVKGIHETWWRDGGRWDFIHYWGYDLQGAVYQELVYQETGLRLPFYVAAVSKETPPDMGVFQVPQEDLDAAIATIPAEWLDHVQRIKDGEEEPRRCGRCDWCRGTKVITKPEILEVV